MLQTDLEHIANKEFFSLSTRSYFKLFLFPLSQPLFGKVESVGMHNIFFNISYRGRESVRTQKWGVIRMWGLSRALETLVYLVQNPEFLHFLVPNLNYANTNLIHVIIIFWWIFWIIFKNVDPLAIYQVHCAATIYYLFSNSVTFWGSIIIILPTSTNDHCQ